jgi:hypothetical protein
VHAGTDYTIFASVVVLVNSLGGFAAGAVADAFGFVMTFTVGTFLAALGCVVLVRCLDRQPTSQRIASAWRAVPQ